MAASRKITPLIPSNPAVIRGGRNLILQQGLTMSIEVWLFWWDILKLNCMSNWILDSINSPLYMCYQVKNKFIYSTYTLSNDLTTTIRHLQIYSTGNIFWGPFLRACFTWNTISCTAPDEVENAYFHVKQFLCSAEIVIYWNKPVLRGVSPQWKLWIFPQQMY